MGKIIAILRKHFQKCQKSVEAKKLTDRLDKKIARGGTQPKKAISTEAPATPKVVTPHAQGVGFGHMPRHGNKTASSEV